MATTWVTYSYNKNIYLNFTTILKNESTSLRSSHLRPTQYAWHAHRLGRTHTPPFRHPPGGKQTAGKGLCWSTLPFFFDATEFTFFTLTPCILCCASALIRSITLSAIQTRRVTNSCSDAWCNRFLMPEYGAGFSHLHDKVHLPTHYHRHRSRVLSRCHAHIVDSKSLKKSVKSITFVSMYMHV